MKRTVAVLAGGDSSEYVISIKSAEQVIQNIDPEKFNSFLVHMKGTEWKVQVSNDTEIEIDKNDFSFVYYGKKIIFDCVFIVIHGTPGEDGILQSYFDLLRIPYSTCDAFTSALTFNKYATKIYLREHGIPMAKEVFLRKNDKVYSKEVIKKLGLPAFVKPNNGGSSFGVTKVKEIDELIPAVELALQEDDEVLIEEFIKSRELTCGVFKSKEKSYLLPITEIISKNEFFDYEAKYEGASDEITPADITKQIEAECKVLSSKIYDILNCKGIVRIDYLLRDNILYFMEINTVPGMSEASIVPQQVRADGMNLMDFYTEVLEEIMG